MAAGHGGKRAGAGAKKGQPQTTANKMAHKLVEERIAKKQRMPLVVMLAAMDEAFAKGGAMGAFDYAEKCAPYLHPKRQPTDAKGSSIVNVKVVNFTFPDD